MGSTPWYFALGIYTASLLGQAMTPSVPICVPHERQSLGVEKKPFRSKNYDVKGDILNSVKKGTLNASSCL